MNPQAKMHTRIRQNPRPIRSQPCTDYGQAAWLDFLARGFIAEGRLEKLVAARWAHRRHLQSLDLREGDRRQRGIRFGAEGRSMAEGDLDVMTLYERLAIEDIQHAADVLRPVFEATKRGGWLCQPGSLALSGDETPRRRSPRRGACGGEVGRRQCHDQGAGHRRRPAGDPRSSSARASTSTSRCCSRSRSTSRSPKPIWPVSSSWSRRAATPPAIASVASFFVSRIDVAVDKLIDERLAESGAPTSASAGRDSGQGRHRQCQARLSALQAPVRRRALGEAARQGRAGAAAAVGEHRHQEQALQRRALCRGADRARHGQHHAAGHHGCVPRPWEAAAQPGGEYRASRAGDGDPGARPASPSTR